jgi:DNA helicase II / ATP-dependent DNA helicase PcrA
MSEREGSQRERAAMSEREGSQRERAAMSEREGSQRERAAMSEREGSQRERAAVSEQRRRAPIAASSWTPAQLAHALRLPSPTAEQAAVIAAPSRPAVVVAGAGSGKTETMAARVVWLVANGRVTPEQVLGLTFTTKAAAELGARLRTRLAQLRAVLGPDAPAPRAAGAEMGTVDGEPTVLTYHAYAARLVAEHALRLAVEPSVRLLSEAMTWQLAQRVVRSYPDAVPELDNPETTVVGWLLDLAGELAEHLVTPAELRRWTAGLTEMVERLPRPGQRQAGRPYADVVKLLAVARARVALLPLVEQYEQAKRSASAMDFGDQMALAARVASRFPEVGRVERGRYAAVLLDEYQDTGHAQLVLLRSLFGGGHPLTAVGDPCQSIYGWRGASAANLARFAEHFPARDGTPADVLPLGTSFRNDRLILTVANSLSADLRASGVDVGLLSPGPACGDGKVQAALLRTVRDEADWLADRVAGVWAADGSARAGGRPGRSVAVLCRRRTQFEPIAQALRARGIPVELVGLGGLIATPEIRDVVTTLRVLSDPGAGDALARLLSGPRWRIGPRDLAALGRRARALAARGAAPTGQPDTGSLVEALDDLGSPERYSAQGYRRLSAFGRELARLRRATAQPLPDLVAEVERTLLLDIEVVAASDRDGAAGRAHLDRFGEVAAAFAVDAESPSLGAFLAYLAAAEAAERGLEAGVVDVHADRVQILTVHAAKGLEWDVVVVPGLTVDVFPDRESVSSSGWATSTPTLPYPLRGDSRDLPDLDPRSAGDQREMDGLRRDFVAACRARGELEERRLAYVAVTRARQRLVCSGYWWDTAKLPRGPSPFLAEIAAVPGVEVEAWTPPPTESESPLAAPDPVPWPVDPLADRRAAVEEGAALVRAALAAGTDPSDRVAGQDGADDGALWAMEDLVALHWEREADLLLAERASWLAGSDAPVDVPLPGHLSVTALVTLHQDAAELARQIRRPLPFRPAPLARRGTAFHRWLEEWYGGQRLLDLDELPGAADSAAAPDADLELLRDRFLASTWAQRRPEEVEVPFEMVVAGVAVRGRVDAVFRDPDGGWTVVDWKTGAVPTGAAARSAEVQLAAYRLAWSELTGTPLELVRAAFHYVHAGRTVQPADLLDEAALGALLAGPATGQAG